MDKKTGILALGTLIGAGLFSSKKFKREMGAETFMAQGKRVNAIRANRINDEESIYFYVREWNRELRDNSQSMDENFNLNVLRDKGGKDYQTYMEIAGMQNSFSEYGYTGLLRSLQNFWQRQMKEVFSQQYQRLDNIYVAQLSEIQTAMGGVMQDFEPIAKNGNYVNQMTSKDFLDSYPAIDNILENFRKTMISEVNRIKTNTGAGFSLPKIGNYQIFTSNLDWANMDSVEVLKTIGLSSRYGSNYMDDNLVSRIESKISQIQNPNDYNNKAYPILQNATLAQILNGDLITEYTKQEIEFIKERIVDNFNVIGYANILGWTRFFKANPSIKTVGMAGQGYRYTEEKYYAVELTNTYPNNNVPKAVRLWANVWDNGMWSSVFTEKEFNLLKQDGMDKLNAIVKSNVAEVKRLAKKRDRLQDSVQEETDKAFLSAIKKVFSDYPNFGNTNQQYGLMQIYYDAIGLSFSIMGYRFPVEVDEFSTLQYGYQGQEPQIIKATTVNLQTNDIRRLCKDKDFQEKVIKLIPQKVKDEAKAQYVATMDAMVKGAKGDVQTAELKLKNLEDKYVQQLKLF